MLVSFLDDDLGGPFSPVFISVAGFYGRLLPTDGDDALDNVDMQTDAGTAATTMFTRYTAAASTRAGTVKSGYACCVVASHGIPKLTFVST